MQEIFNILGLLIAIGAGMGCGSYATMPYYRLPNGIPCGGKWTGKRSACPSCGKKLRTRDLFPVLNWLWTRGQCFNCQAIINPVYFFIEFSITVFSVLLYLKFGFDQMYIITLGLAVCMVILSATQYSYQSIPNAVLIVMIMLGFLYRTIIDGQIYDMVYTFSVAVFVGLAYAKLHEKIRGKPIKNFGLLQILAVSGIWLNTGQLFASIIMTAALSGILIIGARMFGRSVTMLMGIVMCAPFIFIVYYPDLHTRLAAFVSTGGL